MIRHIVMFRFLEEAEGATRMENARMAKEKLEALQGVVPTLRSSAVYLRAEGTADQNYDLVLVSDYDDLEGLEAYRVHPAHVAVGEFIGPRRELRACVDFEI
ncbi:MAG: Dabb family protein [Ruminococcaceae bacterium]|nr:Dabb family protein [Oscillospiraceae bacterium]